MTSLTCRCNAVDPSACPIHKPIEVATDLPSIQQSISAALRKGVGRCSHHFAPDIIGGPCTICGSSAAAIRDEPPAPDDNLPRADPTKPRHYKDLSPEPIDVIAAWGLGFNLGCVVKYVARADLKGVPLVDLAKAKAYLDHEIALRTKAVKP